MPSRNHPLLPIWNITNPFYPSTRDNTVYSPFHHLICGIRATRSSQPNSLANSRHLKTIRQGQTEILDSLRTRMNQLHPKLINTPNDQTDHLQTIHSPTQPYALLNDALPSRLVNRYRQPLMTPLATMSECIGTIKTPNELGSLQSCEKYKRESKMTNTCRCFWPAGYQLPYNIGDTPLLYHPGLLSGSIDKNQHLYSQVPTRHVHPQPSFICVFCSHPHPSGVLSDSFEG
nr:hypothetical protein L203_05532 [Cryptococcus depauperatus CBS 7841]